MGSGTGKLRKRPRVQLDFSLEAYKYLAQTRALAGAGTTAEVVRHAPYVRG
jgi:hypothetical protein